MTDTTPNDDWLDEVLATIGVNGVDDNQVVGRAAAKQVILQHEQQARIDELNMLCEQVKSYDDYAPPRIATLTQQTNQGVSDE